MTEWRLLLERFGSGDDAALERMLLLDLGPVASAAASQAVHRAVQRRLRSIRAGLRVRMQHAATVGDVSALQGWAGGRLLVLHRFASLRALSDDDRGRLSGESQGWVERTEVWLERQAARLDAGGLFVLTLRRSPLRWPPAIGEQPSRPCA